MSDHQHNHSGDRSHNRKHAHDHGHGHHHHGIDPNAGDMRVAMAIAVNMGLTIVQIVGGIMSGSLALLADALHNFSDAISLIIAFGARTIARRPKNDDMTFGYGRIEVVAALINYTTLIVIALYLMVEAFGRFMNPEPVNGWLIVWVAAVALIVDIVTALLTYSMSKDSMNIRAAYLHNVADALGSVGVIIAGVAVLLFDWVILDAIVTLMISVYILWHVSVDLPPVVRILMLASPSGQATAGVLNDVRAVDGVENIHEVNFWQIDERDSKLSAHITIAAGRWGDADRIKDDIKRLLRNRHGIARFTLEIECSQHACTDQNPYGERSNEAAAPRDQMPDHDHAPVQA